MVNEQSHADDRIELEPVTCWPLIYSAAGFVCLGILVVGGLALWNVLQPRSEPTARSVPTRPPFEERQERVESVVIAEQPIVPIAAGRQVVVKREVIGYYSPLPPLSVTPPPPPTVAQRRKPIEVKPRLKPTPHPLVLADQAGYDEKTLGDWLWTRSQEIDLDRETGTSNKVFKAGLDHLATRKRAASDRTVKSPPLTQAIRDLLAKRADLRGLPLADEKDCQSSDKAAKELAVLSRTIRTIQASRDRFVGNSTTATTYRSKMDSKLVELLRKTAKQKVKEPLVVGPLVQMLQVETVPLRKELISTLSIISGKESTRALANLAVFDLSPEVRKTAIAALGKRSADEARPVLLAGLRHVWPPAAYHAAHALVELNDQKAVTELEILQEQPNPCEPFQEGEKWYVRELVRANHLRNCVLCHSPSIDRKDIVTGPVPTPGKALPVRYYSSRGDDPAVRADIVYFRQDFSAIHPVANAKPWPVTQRFDYLVRKRELTTEDAKDWPALSEDRAKDTYPQREAVREALAELRKRKIDKGKGR